MCGIIVSTDVLTKLEDFKKGLEALYDRGPDDSKIVDTGAGLLGFQRLAIMGLTKEGMQPFEKDGKYVVCNGELYGFRAVKKDLEKKGILLCLILIVSCCYHYMKNMDLICLLV